jgi:hypothetical protein
MQEMSPGAALPVTSFWTPITSSLQVILSVGYAFRSAAGFQLRHGSALILRFTVHAYPPFLARFSHRRHSFTLSQYHFMVSL